jgi:UDP-glucose 4-epimerase
MRILVTGGSGFIGKHLLKALVSRGHNPVSFSLTPSGVDGVEEVVGDVRDYDKVREALNGCSAVMHLAALTSVVDSLSSPTEYEQVNVIGTLNVIRACLEYGVRKLIYTSSAAIYGNPQKVPVSEKTYPDPQSPYALTKVTGEYYTRLLFSDRDWVILRLFNVYGPGQETSKSPGVIPTWVSLARDSKDIVLYGGNQTRDFIHVSDVCEVFMLALDSISQKTLNVGSGKESKVKKVGELIASQTGVKLRIEPPRKGEIIRSCADISLLKKLKFSPKVKLEDGIKTLLSRPRP